MFGPLGVPELLFILVLALLIFGPKRLPEVGRTIGKGMSEFRRATSDLKRSIEQEIDVEDRQPPARVHRPAQSLSSGSAAGKDETGSQSGATQSEASAESTASSS